MNAKNYLLNMLLVGSSIMMLASCEKNDVYDPDKAPKKTEDLVVPEGFDWKTSQDVTVAMTSPHATSVAVYTDKSCTQQMAELPVAEGKSSITLEVPKANSSIWFEYALASGGKEVMEVPIQKTATRADAPTWAASAIFPDKIDASEVAKGIVYQPAKDGFGTIMFEDRWPETGDYDFNDFVVNYNIKAERQVAGSGDGAYLDYTDLTITLKLRAMGGSLPYRFCMQIGHRLAAPGVLSKTSMEILRKDIIKDVAVVESNFKEGSVELIEGTTYVILALNGFDGLRGANGGDFYNTEKAHLDTWIVPTITFTLRIDEKRHKAENPNYRSFFEGFGAQTAFDYFLQKTDGSNREIHLIDWLPTELYTTYDKDAGATTSAGIYYCSDKRFVWGLKVPEAIAWPVERQDIIDVYPKFSLWIGQGSDVLEDYVNSIVWYQNKYLTPDANLYIKPW